MGLPMKAAPKLLDLSASTDEELFQLGRQSVGVLMSVVLELHGRGYVEREIAKRCGAPKSTVHDWINKFARARALPGKDLKWIDSPVADIRHCSLEELFASGVKPDVVITDPPYPGQFLPLFGDLARLCAGAEVPLVAVMSGQSHLPKVISLMCEHLRYRWTMAYLTPGQKTKIWPPKVNTAWKPVLLFGSGKELPTDVVSSPLPDKEHHEWGQSERGMASLISLLSQPGQLVCDPFLGGGTTAVEALKAGRRFVGCDVDEMAVKRTMERCMEVTSGDHSGRGEEVEGDSGDNGVEGRVDIGAAS